MLARILICVALVNVSGIAVAQALENPAIPKSQVPEVPQVPQAASANTPKRIAVHGPAATPPAALRRSHLSAHPGRAIATASKRLRAKAALAAHRTKQSVVPGKAIAANPQSSLTGHAADSPNKFAVKFGQGVSATEFSAGFGATLPARLVSQAHEAVSHSDSTVRSLAAVSAEPLIPPDQAYARARLLDGERHIALAVPLYHDASRQGHGEASLRLMEIYSSGADGVSRDYLTAVEFKRLAMQQGMTIEYPPRR